MTAVAEHELRGGSPMDYTLAVGLISGMSIDGIDAALLRVYPDQPFELVALFSRP